MAARPAAPPKKADRRYTLLDLLFDVLDHPGRTWRAVILLSVIAATASGLGWVIALIVAKVSGTWQSAALSACGAVVTAVVQGWLYRRQLHAAHPNQPGPKPARPGQQADRERG